jgi:hypothetical protein
METHLQKGVIYQFYHAGSGRYPALSNIYRISYFTGMTNFYKNRLYIIKIIEFYFLAYAVGSE